MKLNSRIIAFFLILTIFSISSCGRMALPDDEKNIEKEPPKSSETTECATAEGDKFGSIVINSKGKVTETNCNEAAAQSAALYEDE